MAYYKNKCLNNEFDAKIYDEIFKSLRKYDMRISLPSDWNARKEHRVEDIIRYLHLDHPELFYVDFRHFNLAYSVLAGEDLEVEFPCLFEPDKAENLKKLLRGKIMDIFKVRGISKWSAYEKVLFLHDHLASRTRYESQMDLDSHELHSIVNCLLYGRTVCEGMAYVFKMLCDLMEVPCIVVYGKASTKHHTERHAWNIVRIDGMNYHLDVTWDLCKNSLNRPEHIYFNLSDEEIKRDHSWRGDILPACSSMQHNYYQFNRLVFDDASRLADYIRRSLDSGEKYLSFKVGGELKNKDRLVKAVLEAVRQFPRLSPRNLRFYYNLDVIVSIEYTGSLA